MNFYTRIHDIKLKNGIEDQRVIMQGSVCITYMQSSQNSTKQKLRHVAE